MVASEDSSKGVLPRGRFAGQTATLVSVAILGGGCIFASVLGDGGKLGFLGSLHPLLVHFPIALLLLGSLFELFPNRFLRSSGKQLLIIGVLGAAVSATSGLLLEGVGTYEGDTVFRHKVLGITLVLAGCAALLTSGNFHLRTPNRLLLATTCLLVLSTGHLGGTLTHGSGYLSRHLPQGLQAFLGTTAGYPPTGYLDPRSANIYNHLVTPILNRHCLECHGGTKKKGNLRLDTVAEMLRGGEGGPAIRPGDPEASPIVRRTTLPPGDKDHMPPQGRPPVPVGDTEILRWWIEMGANAELRLKDVRQEEIPSPVRTVLARLIRADQAEVEADPLTAVPFPDFTLVERLRAEDLPLHYLSREQRFLEADFSMLRGPFNPEDLEKLLPLSAQLLHLNLSGRELPDEAFAMIARFSNLRRLWLDRTPTEDRHLSFLSGLKHLEYLNLYGTEIGDPGLEHLAELEKLRSLYLWKTRAGEAGVDRLQARLPGLRIHGPFGR